MIRQETITEAEAMKNYLIKKGISEKNIIKEEQSRNTLENFKYSKEKLKKLKINNNIAFVSNNFHILRSKIYALKFKIKAKGEGSKTLWYYFPEAFINEYLALMVLYKNILIIYIILAIVNLLAILLMIARMFILWGLSIIGPIIAVFYVFGRQGPMSFRTWIRLYAIFSMIQVAITIIYTVILNVI